MSPNRHIVPDQVLSRPEPLAEAECLAHVPSTPFAFMRFLIARHFFWRGTTLCLLSGSAPSVEAVGAYALSHLIQVVTAAYTAHCTYVPPILPIIGLPA